MSTEDGKPAKGDKQTALVAQLAEPRPFKAGVVGSNPTGCTKINKQKQHGACANSGLELDCHSSKIEGSNPSVSATNHCPLVQWLVRLTLDQKILVRFQ